METNILILYYSMFGNTYKMALEIANGIREVGGNPILRRVPDLLPEELLEKNENIKRGVEIQKDIPVANLSDLENKDGYIFGSPTRYGNMCSQLRNFLDQTGYLWAKNTFVGKPVGLFTSSQTIHGGQETTLINMMVNMLHYGMVIVGVPYELKNLQTTKSGGTPYGASHVTFGDILRNLDEDEKTICRYLGKRVTEIAKKLKSGD